MALPTTDPPPRDTEARRIFTLSDERGDLSLPPPGPLQERVSALESALTDGTHKGVETACRSILEHLASYYGIPSPSLKVLGTRPRRIITYSNYESTIEKHGDYDLRTGRIRLWMRTAVRGRVVAYKTLLITLIEEFCHHLDCSYFRFVGSPHTRGFYERMGRMYSLALGREFERPVWRRGPRGRWWMDFQAMKARS